MIAADTWRDADARSPGAPDGKPGKLPSTVGASIAAPEAAFEAGKLRGKLERPAPIPTTAHARLLRPVASLRTVTTVAEWVGVRPRLGLHRSCSANRGAMRAAASPFQVMNPLRNKAKRIGALAGSAPGSGVKSRREDRSGRCLALAVDGDSRSDRVPFGAREIPADASPFQLTDPLRNKAKGIGALSGPAPGNGVEKRPPRAAAFDGVVFRVPARTWGPGLASRPPPLLMDPLGAWFLRTCRAGALRVRSKRRSCLVDRKSGPWGPRARGSPCQGWLRPLRSGLCRRSTSLTAPGTSSGPSMRCRRFRRPRASPPGRFAGWPPWC